MIEAVVVEQRAVSLGVGLTFACDGVFGNEFPIELAGAVFEQFLKCRANSGFVLDAKLGKFGERIVVGGYGLVRWLQGQTRHGRRLKKHCLAVNSRRKNCR